MATFTTSSGKRYTIISKSVGGVISVTPEGRARLARARGGTAAKPSLIGAPIPQQEPSPGETIAITRPREGGGTITVTRGGLVTETSVSGRRIRQFQVSPTESQQFITGRTTQLRQAIATQEQMGQRAPREAPTGRLPSPGTESIGAAQLSLEEGLKTFEPTQKGFLDTRFSSGISSVAQQIPESEIKKKFKGTFRGIVDLIEKVPGTKQFTGPIERATPRTLAKVGAVVVVGGAVAAQPVVFAKTAGGIVLGVEGSKRFGQALAPKEQKRIMLDPGFREAMRSGFEEQRRQAKGWERTLLELPPAPAAKELGEKFPIFGKGRDKTSFEIGVRRSLVEQGFIPEDVETGVKAARRQLYFGQAGELATAVGVSTVAERQGAKLISKEIGKGTSQILPGKGGFSIFKRTFTPIAKAGVLEAGGIEFSTQISREEKIKPGRIATIGALGGLAAGTIGGVIAGTANRFSKVSKNLLRTVYVIDPYEKAADVLAARTAGGIAGRIPVFTPIIIPKKGKSPPLFTTADIVPKVTPIAPPKKPKVPTITPIAPPTLIPTAKIPTPPSIPSLTPTTTGTPTPTPTPTPIPTITPVTPVIPTPVPVPIPVTVPTPTTIPIFTPIPVTTVTPDILIPPILPGGGGGGGGYFFRKPRGKRKTKFLPSLTGMITGKGVKEGTLLTGLEARAMRVKIPKINIGRF